MNAARLARRWQGAGEDRVAMAEALVDEVDHPDTGLGQPRLPARRAPDAAPT